MARSRNSYLHNRERTKERSRERFGAAADIGPIPQIRNRPRRESCRLDLHRFLVTYFPASTGLSEFSGDHRRAISRLQTCILEGGQFIEAMFRGSAKTTIGENATAWATLFGHRKFVPIFGGDSAAAEGNIDSIKLELSENDLLYEDFPEVCHAVRALEGKAQRCASQTHVPGNVEGFEPASVERYDGQEAFEAKPALTHIGWTSDTIIFPTIILPDGPSVSSGAIIAAHGLLGASRGMKHKRPDGSQQRPDFVFLDDVQTDESARSPSQVDKRLSIIRKNILRLGGHGRKIAVFMAATVIERGDVPDQLLDAKKNAAWQGERIPMVRKWAGGRPAMGPDREKKWSGSDAHERLWLGDYKRKRETYDPELLGDQERAHREATEFYRANREAMDEGSVVTWQHCFDPAIELSALQHAYNILIDDGAQTFASECQCEPLVEEEGNEQQLRPDEVMGKLNRLPRGVIPLAASRLVVFIDPKADALYWTACAFADGFGGAVVDYGTYPEQGRAYFHSRDISRGRKTLRAVVKGDSVQENVYGGLDRLTNLLMGREWKREDGRTVATIDKIIIDRNWGEVTDTVDTFCRQSAHAAVLIPSRGQFVGATTRPFGDYRPQPGDRVGTNWRIPAATRGAVRALHFDANYWKSFVVARWRTGMGGRGGLTVFGDDPERHKMLADHQCAEFPIEVETKARKVVEFKGRIGVDNDLLDCVVGCHVGASTLGVTLIDMVKPAARKRVKLSQVKGKVWSGK
jgi:hypothetical protein